jgi:hypothetical protein
LYGIRSIDFAKVSKNIALVPHMESFNLPHSISVALNVIRYYILYMGALVFICVCMCVRLCVL